MTLSDCPPDSYFEPPVHVQPDPVCPVCGRLCEKVFKSWSGEIVGCDECLTECDAYSEEECFPYGGCEDE